MEEFNLDMNNILSDEEYAAIVGDTTEPTEKETITTEDPSEDTAPEEVPENKESTEVEIPESVGAEPEETTHPLDEGASSPNTYSSIASAFKEDGVSIFADVDDEEIQGIDSAEAFEKLVSAKVDALAESRLNDVQKRINQALGVGLDPDDIRVYETSLANLNAITDEQIEDEEAQGDRIRQNLIYTNYRNRGFSKEKAAKEVQKSLQAGTVIEDAKEALQENIAFYQAKYENTINQAKAAAEEQEKAYKKQAEDLKKDVLEGENAFGDIEVNKKTRQKIYDAIMKPVYKDPNGNYLTELQKYESEHHNDFMKFLAYAYVMTDGFKSLENLEKSVERKATKKSISALEKTLKSTVRNTGGGLNLVSGVTEEAPFAGGWTINV